MFYICVATIFIFLPWPKSQISMCASGTYGEKRNDLLDEKPTIVNYVNIFTLVVVISQ